MQGRKTNNGSQQRFFTGDVGFEFAALTLDDLKWVVLMVLFNVPGSEQAYAQMEELIFDEPAEVLH